MKDPHSHKCEHDHLLEEYISELERTAYGIVEKGLNKKLRSLIRGAMDGQVNAIIRRAIPYPKRKALGAFFTGSALAQQLVGSQIACRETIPSVMDPACGTGDLLLAYARHLPIKRSLVETLKIWNRVLIGTDIVPQFLRAAKIRLLLLALARGAAQRGEHLPDAENLFPLIRENDGLSALTSGLSASLYVLNPPFGYMQAPIDCDWSSGRVSVAAAFLAKCLEMAPIGSTVFAILPDVLRSGSRYAKWRSHIETLASVDAIDVHGAFDVYADVDVFILRLTRETTVRLIFDSFKK